MPTIWSGGEAEECRLPVVEAKVAKLLRLEQREADGGGAVDRFDLCGLPFGFNTLAVEFFIRGALGSNVAKEDNDARGEGKGFDGDPEVERL